MRTPSLTAVRTIGRSARPMKGAAAFIRGIEAAPNANSTAPAPRTWRAIVSPPLYSHGCVIASRHGCQERDHTPSRTPSWASIRMRLVIVHLIFYRWMSPHRAPGEPRQPRRHTLAPLYARRAGGSNHAYETVCRSDCAERCRAMVKDGMSSRTPRYRAKEINVIKALGGQGI